MIPISRLVFHPQAKQPHTKQSLCSDAIDLQPKPNRPKNCSMKNSSMKSLLNEKTNKIKSLSLILLFPKYNQCKEEQNKKHTYSSFIMSSYKNSEPN